MTKRAGAGDAPPHVPQPGGGKLLPLAGLSGPMPLAIAIMVALTMIAAAGGLALRNVAVAAGNRLAGGITVQIVEAEATARAAQAARAVALLRVVPGVEAVRQVPQHDVDALLQPWLGGALEQADDDGFAVPVPALIDAQLDGRITAARVADLAERLHRVAPAARIDAQADWLGPMFGAIELLQWLAALLVGLLAAAMAAAVLLAVRGALDDHRPTVEIVHMLGGTDRQLARVVRRAIGIDAVAGGVAGLALALVVIRLLAGRFTALDAGGGLVAGGALGVGDWLALLLVPIAGIALAMLTAHLSVLRFLRRML